MKKIIKGTTFAFAMATLLAGCGSTKFVQEDYEKAYASGDYDTCITMLETRDEDSILNGLDSSMLQYLKKDYAASGRELTATQAEMQTVSKDMTASKTMEAALVGENSVTYSGATYERILVYSMKAVDSFKMNNVPSAVGVMNDYTGNYKEEIAALVAQQKEIAQESEGLTESEKFKTAASALEKVGVNLPTSGAPAVSKAPIYEASPFLSYLGTLAYAANGDSVHANDFASVLASTNSKLDVSEDLAVPEGKGRLDVIALTGTIAKRTEGVNKFDFEKISEIIGAPVYFKMVYPEYQSQKTDSVKSVTLSNGASGKIVLIEDFDEAVKNDVESKARSAYNRSLFRNVTKTSAVIAGAVGSVQAAKNDMAKNLAVKAFKASYAPIMDLEKADVRQASYFPSKASAAGFTVEPGTYTVTVEYSDGTKDVIENVTVDAGKPTVVVSEKMN